MPRGRPPIPRTKEEALAARREQVKKNVQAFRRRKDGRRGSKTTQEVNGEAYTFVVEELGKVTKVDGGMRTDADGPAKGPDLLQEDKDLRVICHPCKTDLDLIQASKYCQIFLDLRLGLPPSINSPALSFQQLVSAATYAFVPGVPPSTVGPHWTQTLPQLTNMNSILDLSIQALCLMQIGHVHDQPKLIHQSLSFYDQAIRSLQVTFNLQRDANTAHTAVFKIEIFAAAMGLAAYELLSPGNGDKRGSGWRAHIEGATAYLNMFPTLDVHSFSHHISFYFLECICIFDAVGSRRPSCFSGSKWWKDNVDRLGDEGYEALLRMITTLPAVLEKVDNAASLIPSLEAGDTLNELLGLCGKLEVAFIDWFERTLGQNPACQPKYGFQSAGVAQFAEPVANIHFPSLFIARLHTLYWSSMVLLYESITTVLSGLDLHAAVRAPSTLAPLRSPAFYTSTAHTFALNIRYSVHYCLRVEHGVIGKSVIMLPIWVARNHLRDCGDLEAKWCDGVLEGLGMKNVVFGLRVKRGL